MPYTGGWSVIFGETPSAAKWNQLGTDADFLDGRLDTIEAAYTSFVPSWTNLTVGSGATNTGHYTQIGKTVILNVGVVLGTSPTVGGAVLTLPVTASSNELVGSTPSRLNVIGHAGFDDASTTQGFRGSVTLATTTTANVKYMSNSTPAFLDNLSSTNPFTWVATDRLILRNVMYEAA